MSSPCHEIRQFYAYLNEQYPKRSITVNGTKKERVYIPKGAESELIEQLNAVCTCDSRRAKWNAGYLGERNAASPHVYPRSEVPKPTHSSDEMKFKIVSSPDRQNSKEFSVQLKTMSGTVNYWTHSHRDSCFQAD